MAVGAVVVAAWLAEGWVVVAGCWEVGAFGRRAAALEETAAFGTGKAGEEAGNSVNRQ